MFTAAGIGVLFCSCQQSRVAEHYQRPLQSWGQDVGPTAGAIRHELATGELVGGKSHVQEGVERVANLECIIRREKMSPDELATARSVLKDLKDALAGKCHE